MTCGSQLFLWLLHNLSAVFLPSNTWDLFNESSHSCDVPIQTKWAYQRSYKTCICSRLNRESGKGDFLYEFILQDSSCWASLQGGVWRPFLSFPPELQTSWGDVWVRQMQIKMLALLLVNLSWRIQLTSRSQLVFLAVFHELILPITIGHSIPSSRLPLPQQQTAESNSVLINSAYREAGTLVYLAEENGKKERREEGERL